MYVDALYFEVTFSYKTVLKLIKQNKNYMSINVQNVLSLTGMIQSKFTYEIEPS